MRVRSADRTLLDVRANAEPIEDVMTADYYAQLPQIRLARDPTDHRVHSPTETHVIVDGTDVGRLVECAIRHPNPYMRNAVAAAIWNHPPIFQQIFEFVLDAPEAFREIREIVAEALAKRAATAEIPPADGTRPLLPRMPLPAHLRGRSEEQA